MTRMDAMKLVQVKWRITFSKLNPGSVHLYQKIEELLIGCECWAINMAGLLHRLLVNGSFIAKNKWNRFGRERKIKRERNKKKTTTKNKQKKQTNNPNPKQTNKWNKPKVGGAICSIERKFIIFDVRETSGTWQWGILVLNGLQIDVCVCELWGVEAPALRKAGIQTQSGKNGYNHNVRAWAHTHTQTHTHTYIYIYIYIYIREWTRLL